MSEVIWGYDTDTLEPIHDGDLEDRYEKELDEIYGDVEIGSSSFSAGAVMREMDPIAFRCGVFDYLDSLLSDGLAVEDEDELNHIDS